MVKCKLKSHTRVNQKLKYKYPDSQLTQSNCLMKSIR